MEYGRLNRHLTYGNAPSLMGDPTVRPCPDNILCSICYHSFANGPREIHFPTHREKQIYNEKIAAAFHRGRSETDAA